MRALLCQATGTPPRLAVAEIATPVPDDNQVLVRIRAASINFADTLMLAGRYYVRPEPPFIAGSEFAGVIEAVGKNITGWKPGDHVIGAPPAGGCFAEYIAIGADHLLPVPAGMSWSESAGFIIAYGTAYYALHDRGRLQTSDTLVITGAGGGVGLAAIDIAVRTGVKVIAAAGSADKLEIAAAHGATAGIDYAREDLRGRLLELTGGRGYEVLLDNVGGEVFAASLRAAGRGARLLLVGFAGGSIPEISAGHILMKNLSILGVGFGGEYAAHASVRQAVYGGLLKLHQELPLHPEIDREFPLAEGIAALDYLGSRKAKGKIVIVP
jgi:NADPH2:quinone reductase